MRQLVSSGSHMEPIVGMSRAVRVGNFVSVSGTAPIGPGGTVLAEGDVYGQTQACLEIALRALGDAGLSAADVVRSRLILTDIDTWEAAAKAHGEVFSDIRPACTIMAVTRFVDPRWLVEIELDAVAQD